MSSGDETNINSQVPVARCTWEPMVASCLISHYMVLSSEDSESRVTCPMSKTPRRHVQNRGTRISKIGLTGGKILPARDHYGGIKGPLQVAPGFSSFKLVVPSFQPG
jgi:hypothetical protein